MLLCLGHFLLFFFKFFVGWEGERMGEDTVCFLFKFFCWLGRERMGEDSVCFNGILYRFSPFKICSV